MCAVCSPRGRGATVRETLPESGDLTRRQLALAPCDLAPHGSYNQQR